MGLDAYAILPNPWGHWRAGAGVAIVNEAFSGSTFLAPHALLGTSFDFGPNLALALEWRPGFPVLISQGAGNSSRTQNDLLQYMLLSFGLALELRF